MDCSNYFGGWSFNLRGFKLGPSSEVKLRTDWPNTEARIKYLESIIASLLAIIKTAPVNSRYRDWHDQAKEALRL